MFSFQENTVFTFTSLVLKGRNVSVASEIKFDISEYFIILFCVIITFFFPLKLSVIEIFWLC